MNTYSLNRFFRIFTFFLTAQLILLTACNAVRKTSSTPSYELTLLTTWNETKISGIAWHPTRDVFLISAIKDDGSQELWSFDTINSQVLWSANTFSSNPAFTTDGKFIAETHWLQGFIRLRNSTSGNVVENLEADNCSGGNFAIGYTSDRTLITGKMALPQEEYSVINLWNLKTGKCQKILSFEGYLMFLNISTKSDLIVYGSYHKNNEIVVWNLAKQVELCRQEGVYGLFVPSKDVIAISESDKLGFWDLHTCTKTAEYDIDDHFSNYVDFNPGGNLLATVTEDRLQIRDAHSGQTLSEKRIPGNVSPSPNSPRLLFSPDGKFLIIVFSSKINDNQQNVLQLWRIE
jgi:WD40 repeat protein